MDVKCDDGSSRLIVSCEAGSHFSDADRRGRVLSRIGCDKAHASENESRMRDATRVYCSCCSYWTVSKYSAAGDAEGGLPSWTYEIEIVIEM